MVLPELVSIVCGDNISAICPALGGSIIGWSVGEQEMLRRADADAIASGDPLAMASFPLVPFSNRIGNAQFIWKGREIQITPNFAPEPHAIHGTGWKQAWTIAERSDAYCVLELQHDADARWPWPFEATQRFTLSAGMLELKLIAINLSDEPAPLAFGHHPYFDMDGAHVTFTAARVLMSGEDAMPYEAITPNGEFDFSTDSKVAGRSIDHCYAGWDGKTRIHWTGRQLALEITADMEAAVVYVPKDGSAFCFEPVPHVNNALNLPGELPTMPIVAPGEYFTATILLKAVNA
ncbi:aldose 1-epimerase [Sphingorhabdus sp. EL138]|uniref:aldose 1-epimerase n=1 Tax=Sphingorhabdus sp. EL138 TaxID=2073156 RepID=UPI0025D7875B|nr:aldose 1-epimerase [Sphingorhabdus sp. EL138]